MLGAVTDDDDITSLAAWSLSSATTMGSSYMETDSDWDDMISPRVHIDEMEQIHVYEPSHGMVREEIHRTRRHHISVRRTRKGHIHIHERPLSRDFFLIITIAFAAACFLVCLIRPYTLFWIADAI